MMQDLTLDIFDFELPEELIAQHPVTPRDESSMLCVHQDQLIDKGFKDLPDLLNEGDLLILNNTKVIKSKLFGYKNSAVRGKQFEIMLHKLIGTGTWLSFIKGSKALAEEDEITIAKGFSCKVKKKLPTGEVVVIFDTKNFWDDLKQYGVMPLPPYIRRNKDGYHDDIANYQTVFAQHDGSVAAPTAGLHFSPMMFERLARKNINTSFVTLHVGAGTFLPIKSDIIAQHSMHKEYGWLSQDTIDLIDQTKRRGNSVIAVGTTSMRILEYVHSYYGRLKEFSGDTDLFIKPSFKFHTVDKLITNFHLPKSTLFVLVCAFIGIDKAKNAYKHAIEKRYRFFSYGDCCLLDRHDNIF